MQFQRDSLDTFFETDGDEFLYYARPWSGGLRVSAEEREHYISGALRPLDRFGWPADKRTPVAPPRTWKHRRARQAQSPLGMIGPLEILWGGGFLAVALASESALGSLAAAAAAVLLFGDGVVTCYFRWVAQRK